MEMVMIAVIIALQNSTLCTMCVAIRRNVWFSFPYY